MLIVSSNQPTKSKPQGLPLPSEGLSEDDRKVIKHLVEVLDTFMLERSNIPVYFVAILLKIALDEGNSQRHYRDTMGYPSSTMSRAMLTLGKKASVGDSMGLIDEKVSATSLREYEVMLSPKGRSLVKRIAKKLKGEKA